MDEINDQNTCILAVSFKDENGDPVTPSSGKYKINDFASGSVIKPETSFIPSGSSHNITISSAENKIINESKETETRIVTVIWTYDSKKGTAEFIYKIKNLKFLT